ncbi:MAG: hypothetical protein ACOCRO_04755 [Halanaerobiales bacterium]
MKVKELWYNAGIITIQYDLLIDLDLEVYKAIFDDLIVIDVDEDVYRQEIRYTVASEQFRKLEQGEILPNYEVNVIDKREDEESEIDLMVEFKEE